MHIVTGASGQVGSMLAGLLAERGEPVRAVVRQADKARPLEEKGIQTAIADLHNRQAFTQACSQGRTLFAITPEDGTAADMMETTQALLDTYRQAVDASGICQVVGLSSMGAQHATGTGNLKMSYRLEHAFSDLPVRQLFIRPAYYFSNWLMQWHSVQEEGVLHTFFPVDLAIPMVAPQDVAALAAEVLTTAQPADALYELAGPAYSAAGVAGAFSEVLGKAVKPETIPRSQWEGMFRAIGFSEDGTRNFIEMTEAVIAGKAQAAGKGVIARKAPTTLPQYLAQIL